MYLAHRYYKLLYPEHLKLIIQKLIPLHTTIKIWTSYWVAGKLFHWVVQTKMTLQLDDSTGGWLRVLETCRDHQFHRRTFHLRTRIKTSWNHSNNCWIRESTSLSMSFFGSSQYFSNSVATTPSLSYFFDFISNVFKTLGCLTSLYANQTRATRSFE